MKTYSPKAAEIAHDWHVVDATDVPLGRLASRIAQLLRGKHKPIYAPHLDTGDHVVVVNASRVSLSGAKAEQKMYYRHSGYPGGFRAVLVKDELAKRPIRVVERAVKGMLPHTSLGRQMYRKLHVYAGSAHPHAGQVAHQSSDPVAAAAKSEGPASNPSGEAVGATAPSSSKETAE